MQTELHESVVLIDGAPTDVIALLPAVPNDIALVVVPGNPGVAAFYRRFMQSVFRHVHQRHPVYTVGYAGFLLKPHERQRVHDLDEQVRHKAAFLEYLRTSQGIKEVLILTHSIGAWITVQMVGLRPDLPVRGMIQIYPCLSNFQRNCPWGIRQAMRPWLTPIVAKLAQLLSLVPLRIRRAMMHRAAEGDHHITELLMSNLLRPDLVYQSFYLSRFEHAQVRLLPAALIEQQRLRTFWICGERDTWGPPPLRHELAALCGPERVLFVPECRHAFVIHGSERMAQVVAPLLQDLLHAAR